jgi:Tfp pilus assembly protein PilF
VTREHAGKRMVARVLLPAGLVVLIVVVGYGLVFRRSQTSNEAGYRANNRGVAALERFDYEAAAEAFRDALRIDDALGMARINLAIALLHASHLDEAENAARAAARALPDSPHAHYVLGLVLRNRDRPDEAIAAFTRVAEIDGRDPGAHVNLGQILQEQRRYSEAASQFGQALDAEPYNVTAAYGLATALARAGRAAESATAVARFNILRTSAYGTTYSQSYLEQGRYGEAIASTGLERGVVDETTPGVQYTDATATVMGALGEGSCGSMALDDLDRDGTLDLTLLCGDRLQILKRRDGRFAVASELHLRDSPDLVGAGDFDNDGRTDLVVAGAPGRRLFLQTADGTFNDAAGLELPPGAAARALAAADLDHDGDLDLVIGDPAQVLRNQGDRGFVDATPETGIGAAAPIVSILATDFDDRRDIDVLMVAAGQRPALFRNLRDGRFRDVAAEVGLPAADMYSALAAGDINKDGLPDFFFGRRHQPGLLVMSRAVDRFEIVDAPAATTGAAAAMLADYDNDGLLDLIAATAQGLRLWRLVGERWIDVSERAFASAPGSSNDPPVALSMGDLDNDGDADLVVRRSSGRVRVLTSDGTINRSIHVRLTPRVSNRSALGAKVDVRAGSLRQRLEVSSSTPAVGPADLLVGLGPRPAADVVRVLWPAGIVQAETAPTNPLRITELDRKPSSCPLLFTWNGSQFEFVTDFLGGGEMGLWVGPSVWNHPDPDEYVRIDSRQLQPRDGRYEIRITNELEEAIFIDRLELVAVDHGRGVSVFPNEGLTAAPKPFRLFTAKDPRPLIGAIDDHGHDVRAALAERDRRYPDDFGLSPIQGYAEPHTLTLDLGPDADSMILLLTGWTDYAFSSDNVAAHQAGMSMRPPSLQVRNSAGAWQTAIDEIGFPVGRPQTIALDLADLFQGSSREVRLVTNMRVYWDQIQVAGRGSESTAVTRRDPLTANLRWRGFSATASADGREPLGYDFTRVSATAPWKTLPGAYTREGDVYSLLADTDDLFVVAMPGDEIAVSFDVGSFPVLRPDQARTFLLYAQGYSKEMNPRSATPDRLDPLPFRGMIRYPYDGAQAYPSTPGHSEYVRRYLTRRVARSVPSIDAQAGHTRR